jgi:hypothetical protein
VNVRNDDSDSQWHLYVACLLAAFRPKGPYPILAVNGEHGSAKSTAAKVHRRLVDPNSSATRAAPRDERDLAIAATNGAVISLDNLSVVPDWLSDTQRRSAGWTKFSSGGRLGWPTSPAGSSPRNLPSAGPPARS